MGEPDSVLFHNVRNAGGGHYIKQLELMQHLAEDGVDVTYVSPDGFEPRPGVTHVPDRRLGLPKTDYVSHLFSVFVVLVVQGPERFVPFTLFGGLVGALAGPVRPGTKTVLFVRGDLFVGRALSGRTVYVLLKRLTVAIEWITFRFADRIVFISEQNRETMLERVRLSEADVDSVVLYNNVYTDRVREQLDSDPRSLDGSPVLGYAGGLPTDGGKGLSYLIAAVAKLTQSYPDITLYLLGEGGNRAELERLAREHSISDRVVFTGWVDKPIPYIRSFDLFVLPSLHEGLGNSLLEALAVETAITGSDVGGIPEVIGDRRYLFEPRSPSSIVATVERIFESEASYETATEHCRRQKEQFDFSWAAAATDLLGFSDEDSPNRIPPSTSPLRASRAHAEPK